MELTDKQLIAEAILVNHAGVGKPETRDEYRGFIEHCGLEADPRVKHCQRRM